MSGERAGSSNPAFPALWVGKCKVQDANARFGSGSSKSVADHELHWTEYHSTDPSSEEEDHASSDSESDGSGLANHRQPGRRDGHGPHLPRVPKLQASRNNLTALSQVYNLYFAAYRSRTAVYCPEHGQTQWLGRRPELVLRPPAHAHAMLGYIQPNHGHEVNHVCIGMLGREEVLVLAYDDGDVVVYEMGRIADAVAERTTRRSRRKRQRQQRASGTNNSSSSNYMESGRGSGSGSGRGRPVAVPEPLLHENVGTTAWGIAIHAKSRLIAVSSNRREVTVFAFALSERIDYRPRWRPSEPEANVLVRLRRWRIVLPLGQTGNNVPSIDFLSDPDGFAVRVCAIDINRNIWALDIWQSKTAPKCITADIAPTRARQQRNANYLWGILALPHQAFIDVRSGTRPASVTSSHDIDRGLVPTIRHTMHHLPGGGGGITPLLSLGAVQYPVTEPLSSPQQPSSSDREDDFAPVAEIIGSFSEIYPGLVLAEELGPDMTAEEAAAFIQGFITPPAFGDTTPPPPPPPPPGALSQGPLKKQKRRRYDRMLRRGTTFDSMWASEGASGLNERPRLQMIYKPQDGATYEVPRTVRDWKMWLKREMESIRDLPATPSLLEVVTATQPGNVGGTSSAMSGGGRLGGLDGDDGVVTTDTALLVTSAYDIDLLTRDHYHVKTSSPLPLAFHGQHVYDWTRRLNMLAWAAELGLVVVGSQAGHVMLLSLARTGAGECQGRSVGEHLCYGVEKVLPSPEDEAAGLRPACPLFGIALGPLPETKPTGAAGRGGVRLRAPGPPHRRTASGTYRLMLHYRDHTILSYQIRRPCGRDLEIF